MDTEFFDRAEKVKGMEQELQLEQANAAKEIRASQEIDMKKGVENAEKLMDGVTMDDLLKMCGTVVNKQP